MISIWVKLLAVYTRARKGEGGRKNNSFFWMRVQSRLMFLIAKVIMNLLNNKKHSNNNWQLATVATTINERICASVLIPLVNYEFCQRCQSSCVCGSVCVCLFALLGRQSALAAQGLILFLVSSLCGLVDKPVSIKYLSPRPLLFFIVYALRISSKHSAAVLLLSSLWRLCFILITQNIVHILN